MTGEVHDVRSFMESLDPEVDVWEFVTVEEQKEPGQWAVGICPNLTEEQQATQGVKKEDLINVIGVSWHQQLPYVTLFNYAIIETAREENYPALATYLTSTINTYANSDCMAKVGVVGFDPDVGMTVSFAITLCMPLQLADSADKKEMLKIQFQAALVRIMMEANYGTVRITSMFATTN